MATIEDFDGADFIDVRDVTDRVDELETSQSDDADELADLRALLDELRGDGGDHEWRGDWYPLGLIRDSYMEDYAREFAEDCGMVKDDAQWPYTCIDWKQAAREFQMDYTAVEFRGVTYWYR